VPVSLELGTVVEVGRLQPQEVGVAGVDEGIRIGAVGSVDKRGFAVAYAWRVARRGMHRAHKLHRQRADLDLISLVVLAQVECVDEPLKRGADGACQGLEHLRSVDSWNVEHRPRAIAEPLTECVLGQLAGQREQVQRVVQVHVRDHDRVEVAEDAALPCA
jgi:hypothetical protein